MTTDLASYLRLLPTLRPELAAHWPLAFSRVSLNSYTGFGVIDASAATVGTGWSFSYQYSGDPDNEVTAMFTGMLRWQADEEHEPTLVLRSFNYAVLMLPELRVPGLPALPSWWPQWNHVLYQHLDAAAVKAAIAALVDGLPGAVRGRLEADMPQMAGADTAQIAGWFLGEPCNGEQLDFELPVVAGDVLGAGEDAGNGERHLVIRAQEELDDRFYLNLGLYAFALTQVGFLDAAALPDDAVRAALLAHAPPLIASGTVHRVRQQAAAGVHTDVPSAIEAALDGDVILIDPGAYRAPAVIMLRRAVSIIGTAPGDATADTVPGFPVLRGNRLPDDQRGTPAWAAAAYGVFEVRSITQGLATLANLRIESGAARQGGGIYVDDCHRLWVDNTVFSGNAAYAGGWLFEGFGGGLCTRHAGVLVHGCRFTGNAANGRGGAIGVFGYGWPVIDHCRFDGNRATSLEVLNAGTAESFLARPDGGALAIQMATPNDEPGFAEVAGVAGQFKGKSIADSIALRNHLMDPLTTGGISKAAGALFDDLIEGDIDKYWDDDKLELSHQSCVLISDCVFTGNLAADDGGALYATGLVRARCERVVIDGNQAGSFGGGVRISTACDFVFEGGQIVHNESNYRLIGYRCEIDPKDETWKYRWTKSAGGGIASRTSNVTLIDVEIRDNRAHRFAGGGVFFTSTDDGAMPIRIPGLGTNWNKIRDRLVRDPKTGAPRPAFQAFSLEVLGGTISGNACGWCLGTATRPPPADSSASHCSSPPTDSTDRDVRHAKGGGIYAMRYVDTGGLMKTVFPPIRVHVAARSTVTGNTAAASPTATELYIADFARSAPNDPVADTGQLTRDTAGLVQADLLYKSES